MSNTFLSLINGAQKWVQGVKTSLTTTVPTLSFGEVAFTNPDRRLHIAQNDGTIVSTPLANKFTWPPRILEGCTITRSSSSQISVGTGNVTVISNGGERAIVRVIGPLTHNPSLTTNQWLYVFVVSDIAGAGSPYIASDSSSTGANINVNHWKRLIGTIRIVGGAIDEFINRAPGLFELTANSADRKQTLAVPTTPTLYVIPVPSEVLCEVSCIISTGLSVDGGQFGIRVSSPDNGLPAFNAYTGQSTFDSDVAVLWGATNATSEAGNSVFKCVFTATGQVLAIRNGSNYLDANHHSTFQTLFYQLLNI